MRCNRPAAAHFTAHISTQHAGAGFVSNCIIVYRPAAKDYASIIKPSGSYLVSESNYELVLGKDDAVGLMHANIASFECNKWVVVCSSSCRDHQLFSP
jgi:hypothetical protein